jgi:EAL domain-containing protein (putative c-di-GMP-specific phosphodiesterase class I)
MPSPEPVSTALRILICQGESDRRQELVEHLERETFEVECVQGGNGTCVETVLRFGPHVLIVDENSTHSSIVKLCRTLQRSDLIDSLPVVACVSDVSTGRVERLEQAGVVEVLAAPTHPALIVHCLKRLERIGSLQESGSQPGSMSRWASERAAFEASLREAEQRGELAVCYQPRVDAADGALLGMECLVRWNHPQFGCVPPDQFIPLAEETGLIVSIGEWVLREACTQTQHWRDQGFPDVRVSVNLSGVQFQDADLFATVQRALKDSGLPAQWLELEVTESTLMGDPSATALTLENLKSLGIHISIDDFGTGYSSLSYLKRFPIDALKIDRSFVDEVTTNPDDAAIATAIVLMGHSLRLRVVGEGVETTDQQTLLRLLGCDEIQGYLISPPIPAERFEERFLVRDKEVA